MSRRSRSRPQSASRACCSFALEVPAARSGSESDLYPAAIPRDSREIRCLDLGSQEELWPAVFVAVSGLAPFGRERRACPCALAAQRMGLALVRRVGRAAAQAKQDWGPRPVLGARREG